MRREDPSNRKHEPEELDEPGDEAPRRRASPAAMIRGVAGFAKRNAWLGLAVGAVLVASPFVDFTPPDEVRVGKGDVAKMVGDAPAQEFSHELTNPQAVQVRGTLRLYPNNELAVASPDPDTDSQGQLLSQPVVTTILGMNATVEQTLRLEDGDLEIDLELHATPRLGEKPRGSKAPAPVTLEHEVVVRSRRDNWWRTRKLHRVHLDTRGVLLGVEEGGYRIVFAVDEHLFSLDLELRRAFGGALTTSLASGG